MRDDCEFLGTMFQLKQRMVNGKLDHSHELDGRIYDAMPGRAG